MLLQFGQLVVHLIDETKRLPAFPSRWTEAKLIESESADAVLRIKAASIASDAPAKEGWTEANLCGKRSWVYYDGNGALFAVQFGALQNDVNVLVNSTGLNNIRMGVQFGLLLALHEKCIGLHGVTLLYGNEIVILSAPSGTGKTTLAHLLETYCDALMINGDFALLTPTDNGLMFEPTPFCGSSGRALNHRVRVNRVVFLKQSKTNVWADLTGREAVKQFMNNSFVPDWNADFLQVVQENIMKCIASIEVSMFSFAPDKEATMCFSDHIGREKRK